MFKKKPQIKNLSPLRSSDRRKLADQIISGFKVHLPPPQSTAPSELNSSAQTEPAPTLSSIRNSLIPENCSSARFTTHAGADNKLVSGTVYVGAHPGHEERILWLQWGADSPRLYPTVYTLWQNPGLVPLLLTPGIVVQKLKTGADLMTPGLYGGPPWPEGATKNAIVAAASLERPSVPVWIGTCEIDVSVLGSVQGVKGKAVDGVHWAGDEIWTWSSSATVAGGREAPAELKGWGDKLADDELANNLSDLGLDDENEDALDDGGVSLEQGETGQPDANGEEKERSHEPTTQEIDEAFQQAFLYALHTAKKHNSPPNYGIELPLQPSYLIANMIQPNLRFPGHHYNIKKTSWKNVKKFIKHLDKQQLVKSKDRNGGETVIIDIDFADNQVTSFTPYRIPNPRVGNNGDAHTDVTNAKSHADQDLTLQHLYRASSKLVPDLIPSRTAYYTRSQISEYIRTYIEHNLELTTGTSSQRFIKLNPFIANNILASVSSTADTQILARGEIARDALSRRILDDQHLCIPFWVLLTSGQRWDPELQDKSIPKPKPEQPKVTIIVEKRTGTKTVTRVMGLETFGISPQAIEPDLKKKAASSVTVEQAVGGKPGMMEVMLQGDQRDVVISQVSKRGVKKEWFEVVDKTKKKGAR